MIWYEILIIIFIFIITIIFQLHNMITQETNRTYAAYALYIPERFSHLRREINKTQLDVEYILGFDKNKIDIQTLIDNHESTGKVACHMGHLSIMLKFLETNKDYAIIFEDDIYFKDHKMIKPKLEYIINTTPTDADIVFLSYCFEDCSKIDENKIFNKTTKALCRHAYVVSRNGAKKLLDKTWPMKLKAGDNMYASLLQSGEITGYTINPSFIYIEQNRLKFGSKLANYASGNAPPKCINK